MNDALSAILAIIGAIITVAIISVIVSPRSQAPQVLQAGGGFLSNVIGAAVNPVSQSGSGVTGNGSPLNSLRNMFGGNGGLPAGPWGDSLFPDFGAFG